MKILITGAKGFIGKNLIAELRIQGYLDILEYDLETDPKLLDDYCKAADFVYHLAGVNRPKETSDFMAGNFGFTSILLDSLSKNKNNCPIMLSSSIQAELDNPYGISKKAGEELLLAYGKEHNSRILIYRFPNVFGKWCLPNYNSAIATFCHNLTHDLPITVNDRNALLSLVYIDDVVHELVDALKGNEHRVKDYCMVPESYSATLGEIVDSLYSFKNGRTDLSIPDMSNPLTKKLYSTYLSYLPDHQFNYPLKMNIDSRGSFTEIFRTTERGQISVNISKPGITKGNHWHQNKNEKFLVVSGQGVIRFRKIDSEKIIEYYVDDQKMEVIEIPVGYTHNIENIGSTDLVTIMWVNEKFDPNQPDTYYLEV